MSEVPELPPNHVAGMLLDFVPPPQYEPSKPADYYHCVDSVGKTWKRDILKEKVLKNINLLKILI